MVKQLGGRINIPLEWAQQQEEAHSYATLAGRKERRERKVSVCVAHVPVRARDRYAIARESADRKHENKTRLTVGRGLYSPLSRGEGRARMPRHFLHTTLARYSSGKNLERALRNCIRPGRAAVFLPVRSVTSRHLSSPLLRSFEPWKMEERNTARW